MTMLAVKKSIRAAALNMSLLLVSLLVALFLAELVIRFLESANTRSIGAEIPLDQLNYNNLPVPLVQDPETIRVLSFGDSFAYGVVKPKYSYHQIAAGRLSAVGQPYTVVNLGEPAISFPQYIQAHQQWSRVLDHNIALINIYVGNDLADVTYGYVDKDADPHHALAALSANAQSGEGLMASGDLTDILGRVNFVPRASPLRIFDYAYAIYLSKTQVITPADMTLDPQVYIPAVVSLSDDDFLEIQRSIASVFDPSRLRLHQPGYESAVELARYLQSQADERPIQVLLSPPQIAVDQVLSDRLLPELNQPWDSDLPFLLLESVFAAAAPDVKVVPLDGLLRCATQSLGVLYIERDTHWNQAGNRVVGGAVAAAIAAEYGTWIPVEETRCPLTQNRRALRPEEAAFLEELLATP